MHGGQKRRSRSPRGWFERAMISLADVNVMFGMPPATIELIVLEENERRELEAQRAAEMNASNSRAMSGPAG
jgi:hypothetical protein